MYIVYFEISCLLIVHGTGYGLSSPSNKFYIWQALYMYLKSTCNTAINIYPCIVLSLSLSHSVNKPASEPSKPVSRPPAQKKPPPGPSFNFDDILKVKLGNRKGSKPPVDLPPPPPPPPSSEPDWIPKTWIEKGMFYGRSLML